MADGKAITPIDHALVAEYLSYDPESGQLTWIKKPNQRILVGSVAGCSRNTDRGYIVLKLRGRMYYAHRIAWVLQTWEDLPGDVVIDHRNGDTTDNRWGNIRIGSQSQNLANSDHAEGSSGIRGVIYDRAKKKWRAQISHKNKCVFLGNFDTPAEAAEARRAAEKRLFGEFTFHNSRGSNQ